MHSRLHSSTTVYEPPLDLVLSSTSAPDHRAPAMNMQARPPQAPQSVPHQSVPPHFVPRQSVAATLVPGPYPSIPQATLARRQPPPPALHGAALANTINAVSSHPLAAPGVHMGVGQTPGVRSAIPPHPNSSSMLSDYSFQTPTSAGQGPQMSLAHRQSIPGLPQQHPHQQPRSASQMSMTQQQHPQNVPPNALDSNGRMAASQQMGLLPHPPPLVQAGQPPMMHPGARAHLPPAQMPPQTGPVPRPPSHETNGPSNHLLQGSASLPPSYQSTPKQYSSSAQVFQNPLQPQPQPNHAGQVPQGPQQATTPLSSHFPSEGTSVQANGFLPTPAQQLRGQIATAAGTTPSPHSHLLSQMGPDGFGPGDDFRANVSYPSQASGSMSPRFSASQQASLQNTPNSQHRFLQQPNSAGHASTSAQPITRQHSSGSIPQIQPSAFSVVNGLQESQTSFLGQASLCLYQFAGSLDASNPESKKAGYWDRIVQQFFLQQSEVHITLCGDADLKPFRLGVRFIPRFFQVLSLCGVIDMKMAFEKLTELPVRETGGQSAVVQCQLIWSFRYVTGFVISLQGPLHAEVQRISLSTPAHEAIWRIKSFRFFSEKRETQINFHTILAAEGQTQSKSHLEGTQITINDVILPPLPVNSYGVPEKAMRCLEFAEGCESMDELVSYANDNNGSAKDALRGFTSRIREDHPQLYERVKHLRSMPPPSAPATASTPQAVETPSASTSSPSKTPNPPVPALLPETKTARTTNPQETPNPARVTTGSGGKRKAPQDPPIEQPTATKRATRPRKRP